MNIKTLIEKRIRKAITEKVFPGCVVGVIRKNGEKIILPLGTFTYENLTHKVKNDSIYDVASITKVIPTSSLSLNFIDKRQLNLNDKVIQYIHDLNSSYKDQILIRHLLTQTLYYKNLHLSEHKDKKTSELIKFIKNVELEFAPGEKYGYSNTSSILLGFVLEAISNKPLDVLSDEIFFKPMKMNQTSFHPEKFNKDDIVPSEYDINWRKRLIHAEVHDESAWTLEKSKKVGSAGLFSNVPNLLNFTEMLLNFGLYKGKRYLSKEIVSKIYENQFPKLDTPVGLGWELCQKRFMGDLANENTFGKTGFTGCSIVCDIPREVAVVILSNRIYPRRSETPEAINSVRHDIADIVFDTL